MSNSVQLNNGLYIGSISNETFHKHVKKSKHFLRKWKSWGCDLATLQDLQDRGIQYVVLHESEECIDYICTVSMWLNEGKIADFGYGQQVFLPVKKFFIDKITTAENVGGW